MKNAINWFEIPVKDIQKAKSFYESILGAEMQIMEAMGMKTAFFPADLENGFIGGCIMEGQGYEPSSKGAIVYLNGGEDLSVPLSKVEAAGGKVVLPKTSLGPNGYMAHFVDTEGNKVGFHSMK
ncbi:MAG TPA: VOC family protein [Cytophagales bacterium]|nr:VOC family protein [Cytophagales bacterium]